MVSQPSDSAILSAARSFHAFPDALAPAIRGDADILSFAHEVLKLAGLSNASPTADQQVEVITDPVRIEAAFAADCCAH